jgi:RNA polymerase sigma-70 factor (ECF subfamily)
LQPDDASDVVQDVFRAVARKLVDFHHDQRGDTFRGWLYRITQNKLRDFFAGRREPGRGTGGSDAQRRLLELPDAAQGTDTGGEPLAGSRLRDALLERVRNEFSERDWLVFWRVMMDGQTSKEAGEQFQMSSNAVRLVKMRILRRIRDVFAESECGGGN